MKDDYLVPLADGNYVCTMCGCIVHGRFKDSHIFNHMLTRLILHEHPKLVKKLGVEP